MPADGAGLGWVVVRTHGPHRRAIAAEHRPHAPGLDEEMGEDLLANFPDKAKRKSAFRVLFSQTTTIERVLYSYLK